MMNASPIDRWLAEFDQDQHTALDRLLQGRVFMGALHPNETSEILFRLFHMANRETQQRLDEALRGWLAAKWLTVPDTMPSSRWAGILEQAFFTIYRLNLANSRRWLIKHYLNSRAWLRSLYLSPACEPEGFLLRVLAMTQDSPQLAPLWLRLCRLEEDVPRHYAAIGLSGLLKLPKTGKAAVPPLLFSGLAGMAEMADSKEDKAFWLREFRAIKALNPKISEQNWAQHFFPFIGISGNNHIVKLLGKAIPNFANRREKWDHKQAAKQPSLNELQRILALLEKQPVQDVQQDVDSFLEWHRNYTRQTGISEYLAKAFCNIANKIYQWHPNEANFARQLLEEAFLWEPYNSYVWTTRAKVETQLGRHGYAEALLWEAKRRFPENEKIRNLLANLLSKQGKLKVAEQLYRQTIEDFPQDVVCRIGLADLLKAQERLDEAEAVCRKAMDDSLDNAYCRTVLAEVLKMQGKLGDKSKLAEAERLYRETMVDFPQDVVCRVGLAEMLKLRGALEEAELVCQKTMEDCSRDVYCRTVLAGVLLQGGKREEAIALLEETCREFPQDKFSAEFLKKLTSGQTDELPSLAIEPTVFSFVEDEEDSFADWADNPAEDTQKVSEAAEELAEDTQETALGLLNLHRQAGDCAAARTIMDTMLARNPDSISIPARLEQGLLYLAEKNAAEAAEHFRRQSKLHPNAPSFRLGLQRAQMALSGVPDEQQFQELAEQHPVKETIIRVEQFRLVPSVDSAEKLRRRINKGLSLIPLAERGHEKWFQETVQQTVFKGIDFSVPFAKDVLPKLVENCHNHASRLISATDQCLLAA
jgi:predicted Zn-dependent protease